MDEVINKTESTEALEDKEATSLDQEQEKPSQEQGHLSATIEMPEELSDGEILHGARPVVTYHLADFDGPLDLLVELINKAKIAIEDIFISDVTRQYVEIVTQATPEELDYEYAGEFIKLAAQLVYLKSLRTLPQEDDYEDEFYDDPEVQRRELLNKIAAYKIMKEQAEKLREAETINRFYRMPDYTEKDYRVVLTNFSLTKLVEAYARVMINADRRETATIPKKVVQDRFTISQQMKNIYMRIRQENVVQFTSLFEPDFSRGDILTTFLAVLQLAKLQKAHVVQDELYGEVVLSKREDDDGNFAIFEGINVENM